MTKLATIAALVLMLVAQSVHSAEPAGGPDQGRWRDLKLGLTPLFALGDLDEDGRVDQKDRELLAQIVKSHNKSIPPEVTCPAAADINSDRRIDRRDLDEMDRWLDHGRSVEAPALVHRSSLPCSLSHPFIAAQLASVNGEPVSIQFLDRRLNTTNSSVAVIYGSASVSPDQDGTGFVVKPGGSQAGRLVTVAITLPGKRTYLFTFPVSGSNL
jgi:hypothetical protein